MKAFIALFVLCLSLKARALGPSVFEETYPNYQNYQQLLFGGLKTYFESLPQNSLNYLDINGVRIFKVRNKNHVDFTTIVSKISRTQSSELLVERVIYYLENGNSLEYIVKKTGKNIAPTADFDLLSFRFKPTFLEDTYKVTIPLYKIEISHSRLEKNKELSFFYLGFMEFNMQIETFYSEFEASRNYIYFSKDMPRPQSSLGVKAIETNHQWNGLSYEYFGTGAGEITPKQFFGALADGAGAFSEASEIMAKIIKHIGFPKLD